MKKEKARQELEKKSKIERKSIAEELKRERMGENK